MSATIHTVITCDGDSENCEGTYADGDQQYQSAKVQRDNYKHQGIDRWRYNKGKDICSECWLVRHNPSKGLKKGDEWTMSVR